MLSTGLQQLPSLDLTECSSWQKAAVSFRFPFLWSRVFNRSECHPCVLWLGLLGDAELPSASCQEFINCRNRGAACALCQHVAARSLMACVYATADSAGVCCALRGDKAMTVHARVSSSTAYVKASCFHHAGEGPMSALKEMKSLHQCHAVCPLGYLHGQT